MRSRFQLCFLLVPVLGVLFQFFTKLAAHTMGDMAFSLAWLARAAISPWVWAALISEVLSFVLWIRILATYDLSKAFPLSGISYVLILLTGWLWFHEPVAPLQLIGSALILTGVWLIGTAGNRGDA